MSKRKKSPMLKEAFRSIWQTRTRFLSLLTIVAVGCGFFAGLKASSPDMKMTADKYYEDSRLMDLHMMSTFGLTDEDIEALQTVEGIRGLESGYSADLLLKTEVNGAAETVVKVYSLPKDRAEDNENYLNRPVLLEGRFPEKSGECVIEKHFNIAKNENELLKIGDTITLKSGKADMELEDIVAKDEFEIVGVVQSPLYVGYNRGHSTIGDGEVDAYLMIPEEDFTMEVRTDAYITLDAVKGVSAFSDEYDDLIAEQTEKFEAVADRRGEERYQEIYDEARAEIDDAKAELADGEKERDEKLAEAEADLKQAETDLAEGRKEYEDALNDYNTQIKEAEEQLADGEQKLADGENAYEEGYADYLAGKKEYEDQLPGAQAQLDDYRKQLADLQEQTGPAIQQIDDARNLLAGIHGLLDGYQTVSVPSVEAMPADQQQLVGGADQLLGSMPEGTPSLTRLLTQYVTAQEAQKDRYAQQITRVTDGIAVNLDANDAQLDEARDGIAQLTAGIADGEKQLEDGRIQLENAEKELAENRQLLDEKDKELSDGWQELAKQKKEGRDKLNEARLELEDGEKELADGKEEYETEKADSAKEIEDAKIEIRDAERELADLKEPTWYVWNRDNNPDYSGYAEDTDKVDAISTVFPVFFILVAALVCLTTMTRMVEEQRTQIGTLKALGYSRGAIMAKFVSYAALASLLGSVIGLAIGFKLFPYIIINTYRIMYEVPDPILMPVHWGLGAACVGVALLCMCVTTFAACTKQTAEVPSQLMRPKAPKNGKRVFLEKIGFIWRRLNFSQKVTVRNLFRYKRRVLMTIVGISGCTALMLTGFGLRYAIMSIGEKQYDNVFVYDTTVSLDDKLSASELTDYAEKAAEVEGVKEMLPVASRSIDVQSEKGIYSINLMVPQEPDEISKYIDLHERASGDPLMMTEDGVIINEKLSKLLGVKAGEEISLINPSGRSIPVKVLGISENYAFNYVYMTPVQYEEEFREEPVYSMLLTNYEDGTNESDFSQRFLDLGDGVLAVIHTSGIADTFDDMLKSLNTIVWVLIFSAGLLAFVVLYNLANINVNERVRELATIKVLGFHDMEVTRYITRENNISSFFGILVGLVLGIGLEKFVIQTAEVDIVMFAPDIAWYCFVFAALLTVLFTTIVNIVLHFHLKKIDMVESLKSVE